MCDVCDVCDVCVCVCVCVFLCFYVSMCFLSVCVFCLCVFSVCVFCVCRVVCLMFFLFLFLCKEQQTAKTKNKEPSYVATMGFLDLLDESLLDLLDESLPRGGLERRPSVCEPCDTVDCVSPIKFSVIASRGGSLFLLIVPVSDCG